MKKYFQISYQSLILIIKIYFFNKIRTKRLITELNNYLQDFNFSLTKIQIKRIQFYTIQSCITTSWFCKLRGKLPNLEETQKAIFIGAITPLLDDLVDSDKLSSSEITDLLESDENTSTPEILTIRYLYSKILLKSSEGFKIAFNQALISQDESLKQLQETKLDSTELFEITKNKGSSWTLLYRSILNNPISEKEKAAITTLGEILQLTNDAFDLYKDFQCGQQTVFTNSSNIWLLYQCFMHLSHQMIEQFKNAGYQKINTEIALIQIILIVSRGIICIEQLLVCQRKTNDLFQIEKYSRKELVCDMEKMGNMVKMIRKCYKLSNIER